MLIAKKFPGVALCVVVAALSTYLAGLSVGSFSLEIIGAPVIAIVIGMLITLASPSLAAGESLADGVKFTAKKILQWAVVILGFSLNLGTIATVGSKSLPVIVSTIAISLLTAWWVMKLLDIDSQVATLIGVGSSICGGSAIAATAPVIEAEDKEVAQSISVIFLFNVLAALIFPTLGYAIGLGSEGFAVFAGTAVNDTSSVTAAAASAESLYQVEGILPAAVTVKLTRTLAIIPITLALAFWRARAAKKQGGEGKAVSISDIFPFFILYFVAAAVLTTVMDFTEGGLHDFYFGTFVAAAKWLAKFFIAMAICAIGLNTNLAELIKKGGKPIALGLCCWTAITLMSLAVQWVTGIFYTDL